MTPLTLFRWGYWGWGNATAQLKQAADAIEAARGFDPPVFVDARISRSVRAAGFNGDAFRKLIGDDRYVWMNGLGNLGIRDRTGDIRINRPADAGKLLDLAEAKMAGRRRVIFFCSCEFPSCDGQECHRMEATRLVLAEARKRSRDVIVEEWPGGTPAPVTLSLTDKDLKRVRAGVKSIPLGKTLPSADRLGLPWATVAELTAPGTEVLAVLTGPAKYTPRGWELPVLKVLPADADPTTESANYRTAFRFDSDTTASERDHSQSPSNR